MKSLLSCTLLCILIFNHYCSKINALESEDPLNNTQIINANKYADKYCSAIEENFFEGLDNEKTLKYSYFRYIGFNNEVVFSNDFVETLIHQIKEKCNIRKEEEKELKEFYLEKKSSIK